MTKRIRCTTLLLAGLLAASAEAASVKLTGWFACNQCTKDRVAKGIIRPSNPECSKTCIEKGDAAVFLSEQGKEALHVKAYNTTEHLGYHVEVTGVVDAATKTITIESVKQLSFEGAACVRPRSAAKK